MSQLSYCQSQSQSQSQQFEGMQWGFGPLVYRFFSEDFGILIFKFKVIGFEVTLYRYMSESISPNSDNPSNQIKSDRQHSEDLISREQPHKQKLKEQSLINTDPVLAKIQNYFEQKIIKESISKAVKKTFMKKNIIGPSQFKEEEAVEDGIKWAKNYVDRIETWTADSITNNEALKQFEEYKERKKQRRMQKINSIMDLVDKIGLKLAEKKVAERQERFEQQIQKHKIFIEENYQVKKAMAKIPGIRQRLQERQKYLNSQGAINDQQWRTP